MAPATPTTTDWGTVTLVVLAGTLGAMQIGKAARRRCR